MLIPALRQKFEEMARQYKRQLFNLLQGTYLPADHLAEVERAENALDAQFPPIARETLATFDFRKFEIGYLDCDLGEGYQRLIDVNNNGETIGKERRIIFGGTDGWTVFIRPETTGDLIWAYDVGDTSREVKIADNILVFLCAAFMIQFGSCLIDVESKLAELGSGVELSAQLWQAFIDERT